VAFCGLTTNWPGREDPRPPLELRTIVTVQHRARHLHFHFRSLKSTAAVSRRLLHSLTPPPAATGGWPFPRSPSPRGFKQTRKPLRIGGLNRPWTGLDWGGGIRSGGLGGGFPARTSVRAGPPSRPPPQANRRAGRAAACAVRAAPLAPDVRRPPAGRSPRQRWSPPRTEVGWGSVLPFRDPPRILPGAAEDTAGHDGRRPPGAQRGREGGSAGAVPAAGLQAAAGRRLARALAGDVAAEEGREERQAAGQAGAVPRAGERSAALSRSRRRPAVPSGAGGRRLTRSHALRCSPTRRLCPGSRSHSTCRTTIRRS